MSTAPHTATPDTPVEGAAQLILNNNVSSVIVVNEDNRLEGILMTTGFVNIVTRSQPRAQAAVERYMTTDMITASVQDSIFSTAESMIEHDFHHVPVVDEEEDVIGMIATSDLAAYLSQTGQLMRS